MTVPVPMCLVFRLGGIGFAVPVDVVEEVHTDGSGGKGDDSADLLYRGVRIPRFDLASRFGFPITVSNPAGPILIVRSGESPLAVRVDKVDGVFPQELFEFHPVPPLLSQQANLPYQQLLLWHGQPLIFCDPLCLAALVEER